MKSLSGLFVALTVLILVFVAGVFVWTRYIQKPRIVTKIEWYDKPVFIQPQVDSKPGTTVVTKRDTIWRDAPCDSLRNWATTKLEPFATIFTYDISAQDSLGSFFATENDSVYADPWTRIITLERSFENVVLKLSRVSTVETVTEVNWYVSIGTFVLGMLVVLLLHG